MPQNIYNKNGGKKQWLSPIKTTNSSYALTFMIKVPRPAQQDRRIIYDEFMVYVCDNKNATNARANLTTGVSVKVTGELRIWHDGSYRICANDIQPIW